MENSSRPRAISKIHLVVIKRHAWVNTVWPETSPVFYIITFRKRSSTCNLSKISMLPVVGFCIAYMVNSSTESRVDNHTLINIRSFYVVGSKTYNRRAPFITIKRHIHKPFVHGWIPYYIRSPFVAFYCIACILPTIITIVVNVVGTLSPVNKVCSLSYSSM